MKTDADLIKSLGTDEEAASILEPVIGKLSAESMRKFRENGIPWKHRGKLHRFFTRRGTKLPVDFLEVRRSAA